MTSLVKDSNLKDFLAPSFSPIDYLNATLPSHGPLASPKTAPPPLSALVSQTQSHISALTAQSSRLSATLTALTDDILRTPPRLTYEVELLRGEALSLCDNLSRTGNLYSAISQFPPQELHEFTTDVLNLENDTSLGEIEVKSSGYAAQSFPVPSSTQPSDDTELPIAQLRTLLRVRALLTEVTQSFSLALSWPIPPSLLSTSSALVSVSAPADCASEEKGQAACSHLRQEILDLLDEGEGLVDGKDGLERAAIRVRELRECVGLWKGTAEERPRAKFVDGLERMIEEKTMSQAGDGEDGVGGQMAEESKPEGKAAASRVGPGILRNLQRLREEIYME